MVWFCLKKVHRNAQSPSFILCKISSCELDWLMILQSLLMSCWGLERLLPAGGWQYTVQTGWAYKIVTIQTAHPCWTGNLLAGDVEEAHSRCWQRFKICTRPRRRASSYWLVDQLKKKPTNKMSAHHLLQICADVLIDCWCIFFSCILADQWPTWWWFCPGCESFKQTLCLCCILVNVLFIRWATRRL